MPDDVSYQISKNTGLIFKQLKKFNLIRDPEAESIGYEALYSAVLTYDESKNVRFSTYATVCIYNALGSYVRTLNKQRQLEIVSYNAIAFSGDGKVHEFVDFIKSPCNIEKEYIAKELHETLIKEFNESYDTLTNDKHKVIIALWRDSGFEASMVTIAKQANVSQPHVSQVINSFKFKLRKKMEEQQYD